MSASESGLCIDKDDDVREESCSYEPELRSRELFSEGMFVDCGLALEEEFHKALARQLLLIFERLATVSEPFSFSA